jgi:hypothetical protein
VPQLEFAAKELTDVQVSHVSLVKRGAIRVPFRFLKSDDKGAGVMINLSRLYKTEPQVPMVAAVLVNKAADLNVAKARITKAGFQIETFDDTNEGVILFPQIENPGDITPGENGAYIVKMDEMLSCILTGVEKSFESINFDSTSFDEVMAQEGMRPGVHLSMDILGATVSNIFAKAENQSEMVTDLSKALDEFKTHIVSMAQAVPENAFSIDFFKAEDFVVAKGEDDENEPAPAPAPAPAAAPAANPDPDPAKQADPDPAPPPAAAGDTGMGAVMGQMANLAKGIADLATLTKATSAKVDAQATQLDETAALAKSASDAANKVSNTIRGGAEVDPTNPAQMSKTEAEAWEKANPPLMDTAMGAVN